MGLVIFVLFLWLVALAMLVFGKRRPGVNPDLRPWCVVPGALGWLFLIFASFTVVGAGEVGVPVAFGSVGTPMGPGIHLKAPWADVTTLSTKTANYTMDSHPTEGNQPGNDAVVAHTLDNADVAIDSTVLYHLPDSSAKQIVAHIGGDFETKIVRPTIRNVIGDAATHYDATALASTSRSDFETDVKRRLQIAFGQYDLTIEKVAIRKIELPATIIAAVNAKIAATQALLNLQIQQQQAAVKADIQRTQSKATADAQQIVACGGHAETVAGRPAVVPNDQAHCRQQQLTPAYLQYLYIQALTAMANSPNHSTIIVPTPNNLTPVFQVK